MDDKIKKGKQADKKQNCGESFSLANKVDIDASNKEFLRLETISNLQ